LAPTDAVGSVKCKNGASGEIRTPDPRVRNAILCSLSDECKGIIQGSWAPGGPWGSIPQSRRGRAGSAGVDIHERRQACVPALPAPALPPAPALASGAAAPPPPTVTGINPPGSIPPGQLQDGQRRHWARWGLIAGCIGLVLSIVSIIFALIAAAGPTPPICTILVFAALQLYVLCIVFSFAGRPPEGPIESRLKWMWS
jgi:hypothetical protein